MSVLPRYSAPDSQPLPTLNTDTGPRANAEDFGSAIGAGLQQGGRAIGQVAGDLGDYYERKEKLWLADATSQAEWHWQKRFAEMDSVSLDEIPENYPEVFKKEWNDYTAEQMKAAPSGMIGQAYKQSLDSIGSNFYGKAVRLDKARSVKNTSNNFVGAVNNSVSAALAAGDVAGAQRHLEMITETATGAVPTDVIQQTFGEAKGQIEEAQIGQAVQVHGVDATASALRDGKLLSDRTPEEREAKAAEVERQTGLGVSTVTSVANKMVEEAQNAILYGLPTSDAMVNQARQAFVASKTAGKGQKAALTAGPKALEEFNLKINEAKLAANVTKSYVGKPLANIDSALERMIPQLGKDHMVIKQLTNMRTNLVRDPVSYAIMDTALNQENIRVNSLEIQSRTNPRISEQAWNARKNFTEKIIAIQKSAGVPDSRINVLPQKQAAGVALGLKDKFNADPTGGLREVDALSEQYGPYTGKLLRQMSNDLPAGYRLPVEVAIVAGLPQGAPWRSDVAKILGKDWQDKESSKTRLFKDADLTTARSKVEAWKELDKLIISQGLGGNDTMEQYASTVDRYADYLARTGQAKDIDEAVKLSYDRTLGSLFSAQKGVIVSKVKSDGSTRDNKTVQDMHLRLDELAKGAASNVGEFDTSMMEAVIRAEEQPGENLTTQEVKSRAQARMGGVFWRTNADGNFELRVGGGEGTPVTMRGSKVVVSADALEQAGPIPGAWNADKWYGVGKYDKELLGTRYRLNEFLIPDKPEALAFQKVEADQGESSGEPIEPGNPSPDISQNIVELEGRFKNGKLQVYKLPSNDGGGTFEVAGINDRYHPEEARKLKGLIEAGKNDEAKAEAAAYIQKYTDGVAKWTSNKGVESYLRDTAFNRGPGGAAKVLQMALGVSVDGKVGPKTLSALKEAEKKPQELLGKLRIAREKYELKVAGRRENLWEGLVNRWDKSLNQAKALT